MPRSKEESKEKSNHKFKSLADGKRPRTFQDFFRFLPEMWMKQCVRTAMERPEASDVVSRTDETEAPIPAPAAAPQTMKT